MLKTEAEYIEAMKEAIFLMDAEPNSPEEKELDRLATLIEAYEDKHYPIEEIK